MESFILLLFSIYMFLNFSAAKIEFNTYPTQPPVKVTVHVPKVIAKSCLLKSDEGPCRSNIPMYFFDTREENCTEFRWGGCQGNGNRFDTYGECVDFCLSKPNAPKKKPNWCSLAFDYGYCFGAIERYYYDSLWKVCKKTIYSGCGGNKNNFYNKAQCESICRFGIGAIPTSKKPKDGKKKILIINPRNTTSKKGAKQTTESKEPVTDALSSTETKKTKRYTSGDIYVGPGEYKEINAHTSGRNIDLGKNFKGNSPIYT